MNESDCKLEFLKFLQHQDMFGSTFFVVNQKTVNHFPSTLLIAINRSGFHIMDAKKVNSILKFNFLQKIYFPPTEQH